MKVSPRENPPSLRDSLFSVLGNQFRRRDLLTAPAKRHKASSYIQLMRQIVPPQAMFQSYVIVKGRAAKSPNCMMAYIAFRIAHATPLPVIRFAFADRGAQLSGGRH